MKNLRLFYTKGGRMRFVSHLDMTRFMTRIIRRTHLPVWYTEGFNPHLYLTFALPLSLGMESSYEIMDIRLTDDNYPIKDVCDNLNAVCGEYIRFFDACEPVLKAGAVAAAEFEIRFDDGGALSSQIKDFFNLDSITVLKKTKKGDIKELEVSSKIIRADVTLCDGNTLLSLTLPAGSQENLNPELLLTAFFEKMSAEYYCYIITRTAILDADEKLFK